MDTSRDANQLLCTLGQVAGTTLVLLLATVVFIMAISGSFRNCLQEWLGPWLLTSAVAMGTLPPWTLLDATNKLAGLKRDTHGHGSPKAAVLPLLPVLLLTVSASASLGADAASGTAAKPKPTAPDTIELPSLPTDSVTEMSVQDSEDRYAFGDPKLPVEQSVWLLDFVAKQLTLPGGQWSVNRFRIYCRVADASLFIVPVERVTKLEGDDVWAGVEGVINLDTSKEHSVSTAPKVKMIQQSEDPYL